MTEISNTAPAPEDEPKKPKSRARRQAASPSKRTENPAASLIAALKFIAPAQKKAGPTSSQFCHIAHNWVAASDEVLTIAAPVVEDLAACPQTFQFIEALSKIGDDLSITQLGQNSLAVASGAFRALVPCVDPGEVPICPPDAQIAVIDDRIKLALAAVMAFATEGSPNPVYAAVLLCANSAVTTNGHGMLEYWHGIDLPPNMLIPKASAVAIAKSTKSLTGFGYGVAGSSATFWFEDGSFIKTQLFAENYPNFNLVLQAEDANPLPVPDEFFKAVRSVEAFSGSGNIYFDAGAVQSSSSKADSSTYKIEGLPERMGFNAKYLLMAEEAFKSAHFDVVKKKVVFFGPNMRGAIMGLNVEASPRFSESVKENAKANGASFDDWDDDIPF